MATDERRPIDKSDYRRAYTTVSALWLHATGEGEDGRPVWEVLRDIHEDYGDGGLVQLDDLVGDAAANREVHHALILLELLARGETTMPNREIRAINTVCATPGCPNLTHLTYCLNCELEKGSGR